MYPVLLSIGPVTIYSLWIFIALGFFAALLIMNKLILKNRLQLKFISDHSLAIFFAGLIVARLVYVIKYHEFYFQELSTSSFFSIFYIWDKGLSAWGGLTGIGIGLLYFTYKEERENMSKWFDIFSVSVLGTISIINIGALLDGRNYGRETSLPWGVTIENSIYAVPIHPTQIYATIYTGVIALVLYNLFNNKIAKDPWTISLIALGGYSFFKFLEEFLRGDESFMIFGIREMQIFALLGIIIAIIIFFVKKHRKTNTSLKQEDHANN